LTKRAVSNTRYTSHVEPKKWKLIQVRTVSYRFITNGHTHFKDKFTVVETNNKTKLSRNCMRAYINGLNKTQN